MSNCHNLFQQHNTNISLTQGKRDKMTASKEALREKIRVWFKKNHPEYIPQFYIQGSYKMKTGIRTKDDICDLDDGVYFFRTPDVTATTLQSWVHQAVDGHTDTPAQHRKKCIRTIFAGDYEVDHPVYIKEEGKEYQLAVKDNGFENSDPKAMVDWFNSKKDANGQLLRIVKYLKSWCDHKRNKMPNGLSMTILASNAIQKFSLNSRDDISLRDVLKEIKKAMDTKFECIVPVVPKDDLFIDYDSTRKANFLNALDEFISDADKALKENNQYRASLLWRKHLGTRFPFGIDKDENASTTDQYIIGGARTSNPWGC